MDDPLVVSGLQGIGNLERQLERFFNWDGTTIETVRQGVTFNKFENKEVRAIVFFKPVDGCDVRVIQRCKEFRFSLKPCEAISVFGKLFWQRLYRNFTPEFRVLGTPHFPHSTLTQER